MYAIIESGGKQCKVTPGKIFKFEKLDGDVGATLNFDKVLMVANGEDVKIGMPYLSDAKVVGEVVEHVRGEKIHIIKFRRRKHFMKKMGHRQHYTAVKVTEIIV